MAVAVRPLEQEERDLVVHAWLESFRLANTAGLIAMDRWWDVMAPEATRILDREGTETLVAYETEEESGIADLYGFLVFDKTPELPYRSAPMVYYAYTKGPYRKAGYQRLLFEAAGIDPSKPFVYSCSTPAESEIRRARKIPCAQWKPLLARFPRRKTG